MSKTHSSSNQRSEKKFPQARSRAAQKPRAYMPSPLAGQGRRIMDIEAALSPFWAWRINSR